MRNLNLNIRIREACLVCDPSNGWAHGDAVRRSEMSSQQWAQYRSTQWLYDPSPETLDKITDALWLPAGAMSWTPARVLAHPTTHGGATIGLGALPHETDAV